MKKEEKFVFLTGCYDAERPGRTNSGFCKWTKNQHHQVTWDHQENSSVLNFSSLAIQ